MTEELKGTIKEVNGKYVYYDKNGTEITDGCTIKWDSGKVDKVYLTEDGELGHDATNPVWIENGRALPCEYGIYPFDTADVKEITVID